MGAAVERVAFPVPPKSRFEEALKKRSDALGEQKIAAKNGEIWENIWGKGWETHVCSWWFSTDLLFVLDICRGSCHFFVGEDAFFILMTSVFEMWWAQTSSI